MNTHKHLGLEEVLLSIALSPVAAARNAIKSIEAGEQERDEQLQRSLVVADEQNRRRDIEVAIHDGVTLTPKGQKLVNHYRGGYHYFTVAD